MKKPKHPQHSFHEPKETYVKEEFINFSGLYGCSLKEINDAWNCTLQQHIDLGHTITKEPEIDCSSGFGEEPCIKYSYSYINLAYESEKKVWDERLEKYKEDLAEYDEFMLKRSKARSEPKDIDEKILRAEQRLANLKAAKAGEEIPFPDN